MIDGELFFTSTPGKDSEGGLAIFVLCFGLIALIFALISQRTAKLFTRFRPLTAYTLDIGGSVAGILTFMLFSYIESPAWCWFILVTGLFVAALPRGWKVRWIPLVPGLLAAFIAYQQDQSLLIAPKYKGALEVRWSPYQKVEYVNVPKSPHTILVNGVVHQVMELPKDAVSTNYLAAHRYRKGGPEKLPPYQQVLIIGAGSGNDVLAALNNGAKKVDAVEIDPVIARLGARHHPGKPYDDPRVKLTITDGRAFLTNTRQKYDMVVFALTDSLVKVSSMAQLRLENYLFTRESLQRAFEVLAPGGDIFLYNYDRKDWLLKKLLVMVYQATGRRPRIIFRKGDFLVITCRKPVAPLADAPANPKLEVSNIPTDDWPFLYLKSRGIPAIYAKSMLGMMLMVGLLVGLLHLTNRRRKGLGGRHMLATKLAFVFMGIAFLLLETKSIIQFSLLFGTTWLNNSLVFLAVLLLVLAANWTALLIKDGKGLRIIFLLLLVSSLFTVAYPMQNLLRIESSLLRFIFASVLTFSPIFFANLVFSLSFRNQPAAEHIFGWNLIGAMIGGLVEYTSMALGYNLLAVIVAASYAMVWLLLTLGRRWRPQA